MSTASDYDKPRAPESANADNFALRELTPQSRVLVDDDPNDIPDFFELPGADLSGEELAVTPVPKQADEFTCSSCFLVQHRSRLRKSSGGLLICADCV